MIAATITSLQAQAIERLPGIFGQNRFRNRGAHSCVIPLGASLFTLYGFHHFDPVAPAGLLRDRL
jgi:hypothetical protein